MIALNKEKITLFNLNRFEKKYVYIYIGTKSNQNKMYAAELTFLLMQHSSPKPFDFMCIII